MSDRRQYHLIIFGSQGSGKGTQAKILADQYNLVYLGTGELFRELAEENTALGKRVRETVNRGNLVPDALVDQIVALKLGDIPPSFGFMLDGYPRTVAQAEVLHKTLNGLSRLVPRPLFLNLEVSRRELVRRLHRRRVIENRADETDEAISQRLKIYQERTKPLLDSVRGWAGVLRINGEQSIAAVTKEIIRKLEQADGSQA